MYYSGQYSHTQCGPTSTHGSLSLKSYVIVLYFKNATYMTKRTAQLFNPILCIWIVPPQCTFYSFSNYVNVIQTGMWKQVSGYSTRPAFSYMLSPLHCTKCADVLAQHVASGSNLQSVITAPAHDLLELAYTSATSFLFLTAVQSVMKKFTFHHKY